MADKKISQLPASSTPLAGTEELAIVQSSATKKVSVDNLLANAAKLDSSNTFSGNQTVEGNVLLDNGIDSTLFLGKGAENVDGVVKLKSYQSGADTDQLGISFYVHPSTVGSAPTEEAIRVDHNKNLVFVNSGSGIDFSADGQAAGMTSELLDDYEEGTFTPTVTDGVNNPATGTFTGRYTKIGRVVNFDILLENIDTTGLTSGSYFRIKSLPFVPVSIPGTPIPISTLGVILDTGYTYLYGRIGSPASNTEISIRQAKPDGTTIPIDNLNVTSGASTIQLAGYYIT